MRPSSDVKYLIKWLHFRLYNQKVLNFDIWRPFLEVWWPQKGWRPLFWEPLSYRYKNEITCFDSPFPLEAQIPWWCLSRDRPRCCRCSWRRRSRRPHLHGHYSSSTRLKLSCCHHQEIHESRFEQDQFKSAYSYLLWVLHFNFKSFSTTLVSIYTRGEQSPTRVPNLVRWDTLSGTRSTFFSICYLNLL